MVACGMIACGMIACGRLRAGDCVREIACGMVACGMVACGAKVPRGARHFHRLHVVEILEQEIDAGVVLQLGDRSVELA
jgi:hypothetical protein